MKKLARVFLSSTLSLAAAAAVAGPEYCSQVDATPGQTADGQALSNVKFRSVNSNDCYGLGTTQLNGDANELAAVNSTKWATLPAPDLFSLLQKSDNSDQTADVWKLTAGSGSSGTWNLTYTGAVSPLYMDFVVLLKAAQSQSGWALYFFDNVKFTSDENSGSGSYQITWTNNGGNTPGLSHLSLFGRIGEGGGGGDCLPGDPSCGGNVPEPHGLALVGLGLLGVAVARRRRMR